MTQDAKKSGFFTIHKPGQGKWVRWGTVAALTLVAGFGTAWLVQHTHGGQEFPPSPIGLYFARLWYFEKLYPLIFAVSALGRVSRLSLAATSATIE